MSGNFDDLSRNIPKQQNPNNQQAEPEVSAPTHPSFRNFPPTFFTQSTNPNPDSVKLAEKKRVPQNPASLTNINNPNVLDQSESNPFEKTLLDANSTNFTNLFSNLTGIPIPDSFPQISPKKTPSKLSNQQIKLDDQNDFSFRKVNPKTKSGHRVSTPIQNLDPDVQAKKTAALLNLGPVKISPITRRSPKLDLYKNLQDKRLNSFMSPGMNHNKFSNSSRGLSSKFGTSLGRFLNFQQSNEYQQGELFSVKNIVIVLIRFILYKL